MKKVLLFLSFLLMSIGVCIADESVTFTASTDYSLVQSGSITKNDITITGISSAQSTDFRIYKGTTLSISSIYTITSISFTFTSGSNNGGWNGNSANYSETNLSTNHWSKTTTSGNSGKQARITNVVITYIISSTYTVLLNDRGIIIDNIEQSQPYEEVSLPDIEVYDECDLNGWKFMGWSTSENIHTSLFTEKFTPTKKK